MSEGISEDEYLAEIDRLQVNSTVRREWTEKERGIVRYARGKLISRQILVVLNRHNKKVGQSLRTRAALDSQICRMIEEDGE